MTADLAMMPAHQLVKLYKSREACNREHHLEQPHHQGQYKNQLYVVGRSSYR